MKKKFVSLIMMVCLLCMTLSCYAAYFVTMYSLDGRTISVSGSEVEAYKRVGWYSEPVTLMYAPDGRTAVVASSEVNAYKSVGWFTTITMYAPDGRTVEVNYPDVSTWQSVGWYTVPVTVLYAADGRTIVVASSEKEAYKSVGWSEGGLNSGNNNSDIQKTTSYDKLKNYVTNNGIMTSSGSYVMYYEDVNFTISIVYMPYDYSIGIMLDFEDSSQVTLILREKDNHGVMFDTVFDDGTKLELIGIYYASSITILDSTFPVLNNKSIEVINATYMLFDAYFSTLGLDVTIADFNIAY